MGCSSSSSSSATFASETGAKDLRPATVGDIFYPSAKYFSPQELGYQIDFCYYSGFFQLYNGTERTTGDARCFKVYPSSIVPYKDMMREIEILTKLSHKSRMDFPHYKELIVHENLPYVITSAHLPYSLEEKIPRLTSLEKGKLLKSIIEVIRQCHKNNVVLCTLHPRNIRLREEGEVIHRVGDIHHLARKFQIQFTEFSGSVLLYEHTTCEELHCRPLWPHLSDECGPFIAPELALRQSPQQEVDSKADIWSLGMITYLLMYGSMPKLLQQTGQDGERAALPPKDMYCELVHGLENNDTISINYKAMILRMLESNPAKRCDLQFVKHHPCLRSSMQNILLEAEHNLISARRRNTTS